MFGSLSSSEGEIVLWLRTRLSELCGVAVSSVRVDEAVTRYGMDSPRATKWIADLAAWLGVPLSPVLAYECPTIERLARRLCRPRGEAAIDPRAEPATGSKPEPIAIVGMSCRFPEANTTKEFWELLCAGRHVARQVDDARWPIDRFHAADPRVPGRSHTRWASLLADEQLAAFDPLFFNISPREAEEIDPQQRMFLELCWEALQDAGLRPFDLSGSRTGVFAGVIWDDYGQLNERDPLNLSLHSATGKARGMVPNRVSYVLGLQGPSVAVDTACSSSLSAVHLACQSLLAGDCEVVLAGGINLLLDPVTMVGLAKFGGLSAGSKCRAFDAAADGFVRGEGGGVVVLKRLSRARAEGDRVYAVIGGTAINNDGPSNGLTAPNPLAQEDVLRRAWSRFGIDPAEVSYVEAHGTGTSLGDPIEARALGAVFGHGSRTADNPLRVGSVKTNIGHLEAAAGMAGLIKTALILRHGAIPPSLHLENPNPYIDFDELRLRVQTELTPLTAAAGAPARAGVSAFGWGGTNCHLALEAVPESPRPIQWRSSESSVEALRAELPQAGAMLQPAAPGAVRVAITALGAREAAPLLRLALDGQMAPGLAKGVVVANPKIAFVCSPQGGQWVGMGRSLLASQPVFRRALREVHEAYAAHASWSLLQALTDDDAGWAWQRVNTIQPMIAAVQVGIAALWRSWGVTPDFYVGHSLGELTAAHLCGALGLDDFARLAIHYSRLQATTDPSGAMAIVGLGARELAARGPLPAGVSLAGENSPSSSVLSGARALLEPLVQELGGQHVFARFIDVNVAAHSPHIDPILTELGQVLAPLRPGPGHTPMFSTLWAREVSGRSLGAEYWPTNLRQPVRFSETVAQLAARGVTAFVEVNPHPILLPAIRQTLQAGGFEAVTVESTRRGEDETTAMMEALGQLFVSGHDASCRPRYRSASRRDLAVGSAPHEWVAPQVVPLVLSGRSPGGLEKLRESVRASDAPARELAGDLARLDGRFPYRYVALAAVDGDPRASLVGDGPQVFRGEVDSSRARKVAFVCPGQGAQWRGMARDLLASEPVFADSIARIDQVAAAYLDRPLRDELLLDGEGPWRIDVIQPLLFAIEVALGELWRSWGVVAHAVVGHSMGEVAAIYLAGAISLEDAVRVICVRSKLLVRAAGQGAMLATELSSQAAQELIASHQAHVAIAVSNSPTSTVLSGDAAVLEGLRGQLDARGVFCRWVKVDVASHSPQMDPLLDELRGLLDGVSSRAGEVPIYSTVHDACIDGAGLDASYWVDNLRGTVFFGNAIAKLLADGFDMFVELSPHPILLSSIEQCIDQHVSQHVSQHVGQRLDSAESSGALVLGSMRREEPGVSVMLESAAKLYALGHEVRWETIAPHASRASLSVSPWEREAVWLPAGAGTFTQARAFAGSHPLLGARIDNAMDPATKLWIHELALGATPYLADHKVRELIIASVAVTVEMALAALAELAEQGAVGVTLREVVVEHPLVLTERGHRTVQIGVRAGESGGAGTFGVFSRGMEESAWTAHLRGEYLTQSPQRAPVSTLAALQGRVCEETSAEWLYSTMASRGLAFGPAFRPISRLWRGDQEALAQLEMPQVVAAHDGYVAHPVLLDGALQVVLAALEDQAATFLSVGFGQLHVLRTPVPGELWSHAQLTSQTASEVRATITVYDAQGQLVARADELRLARVEPDAQDTAEAVAPKGSGDFAQQLSREPAGPARRAAFEVKVREQVGLVLKISPERIDRRKPLQAMGLTSLMTIELRNRLGALVQQRLSATLAWNYPTLEALLGHLATLMPVPLDHDAQAPSPTSPPARSAREAPRAVRGSSAPPLSSHDPRALAHSSSNLGAPLGSSEVEPTVGQDSGGDPGQDLDALLREELAKINSLLSSNH